MKGLRKSAHKTGTLIQALRHLGQKQVDDKVLAMLGRHITAPDRPALNPGKGRFDDMLQESICSIQVQEKL